MAEAVRAAYKSGTPVYPSGGETSLDYGLPIKEPGVGLSLLGLNRVVDYPARDMTITVEAGVAIEELAKTMAAQGQRLPIDVPHSDRATIGGVVATNTSGPRRYGAGTVRDYVIGITAVDGRGVAFKGGGRVVKNVAGYDFCKLLTGSMGALGVITQLTLKAKPIPEASEFLACSPTGLDEAERLLARLVGSSTTPAAIELLTGPDWQDDPALATVGTGDRPRLVVGFEGTRTEVDWMKQQLADEWREQGVGESSHIATSDADELWQRLSQFPAEDESPLVLRVNVLPSAVTRILDLVGRIDKEASVQVHAGNGIVIVRFAEFTAEMVSRDLVGRLQPAAVAAGGNAVVLSSQGLGELTHRAVWGATRDDDALMRRVKEQFDPKGILNRGRFLFGT